MVISVADYKNRSIVLEGASFPERLKEQICYDLHVGSSIKLPGDDTRRPSPRIIRLKPNDCVRIETREELFVPNDVFGTVCSRASLTAEGLVAANLKIDPKFQGKLVITVYNTSKNLIKIDKKLPFCSLFFQTLETPVPADSPVRTPPEAKIISGNLFLDALMRARPHIFTFIASVLASIVAAYLFGLLRPRS
jgi:deoxycytidine triphosphate deaminase